MSGLCLDSRLNFKYHLKENALKVNEETGFHKKLGPSSNFGKFVIIYEPFVRLYLNYADVIYDQPHRESSKNTLNLIRRFPH